MFPIMLALEGRRCLVVGGGGVALRKIQGLVAEGARVTVIAPVVVEPVAELAARGSVILEQRVFADGDTAGFVLVFAATDDREVNRRVFEEAEAAGVWANVADDPELCSFHLPGRVQRGALQLAIASGGEAPFVVRRLRQVLEGLLGPEWAEWAEAAGRFRSAVRDQRLSTTEQEARFDRFFTATVDPRHLSARVPGAAEEAQWLEGEDGDLGNCEQSDTSEPTPIAPERAFVALVGAGPGCPGLLTVRARQRLLAADAVVYDRLAAPALPGDLPARTELHPVGKTAGHHPVPQEEINALLIRLARAGKRVVRLKGGDPYVFGRGGEEAEALAAAGIPFEVVPGVTSGIAAPAFMGIPVTHRSEAVRLTLLTAHECAKDNGPQVRWDLLAQDPHNTLVGYMGVTSLPRVVERLVDAGMDPATPAALVERGSTSAQREVVSTLAGLVEAGRRAGIRPPALFIIGPTVGHAHTLGWWRRAPLAGQRLVVSIGGEELATALEANGAEVVAVPLPVTPAARVAMGALPLTGCVLRNPAEVDALDDERGGPGWDGRVMAWCLGEATARRARARGWRWVEVIRDDVGGGELVARIARLRPNAA